MTDYYADLNSVNRYQEYFDGPLTSVKLDITVTKDEGKNARNDNEIYLLNFEVKEDTLVLRSNGVKTEDGDQAAFDPLVIVAIEAAVQILENSSLEQDVVNPINTVQDKDIEVRENGDRV